MLFKSLIRPVLFQLSAHDPEDAHHWLMTQLAWISHHPTLLQAIKIANAPALSNTSPLARTVFGIRFPNPIGLAGGFDKNGLALPALAALGFGFIEAGTVTRHAQPGNPRPRLFRISQDNALINRMGFPNDGADTIAHRLARLPRPAIPIGWSLGKSKITPQDDAIADYLYSLQRLHPFADFFTINVSSPNTPGLRKLQEKEPLDALLHAVVQETQTIVTPSGKPPKPVLLKIAPDLTWEQIDDVIEVALARGIRGIIATNTTLARTGLSRPIDQTGGLSGRPLAARALEVVTYLCKTLNGQLPVIGVGGIFTHTDAQRMFDAGASLIQIYTSFIYEGPGVIKRLCQPPRPS